MLYVPPGFVWCEFNAETVIGVKIPAVDVSHLQAFEFMKRDFSLMKLGEIPKSLQATIDVLTTLKAILPKSGSATEAIANSSVPNGPSAAGAMEAATETVVDKAAAQPEKDLEAREADAAVQAENEWKWRHELAADDGDVKVGDVWLTWTEDAEPDVISDTLSLALALKTLDGEEEMYKKFELEAVEIKKVNSDQTYNGLYTLGANLGTEVDGIARRYLFAKKPALSEALFTQTSD